MPKYPELGDDIELHFDEERAIAALVSSSNGKAHRVFANSDVRKAIVRYLVHAVLADGGMGAAPGYRTFQQIHEGARLHGDPSSLKNQAVRWEEMWLFIESPTPTTGPWRIAVPFERISVKNRPALDGMFSVLPPGAAVPEQAVADAERHEPPEGWATPADEATLDSADLTDLAGPDESEPPASYDVADPALLEEIEALIARGSVGAIFHEQLKALLVRLTGPSPTALVQARAAWIDGLLAFRVGELDAARASAESVVAATSDDEQGDPILLAQGIDILGAVAYREGRLDEAGWTFALEHRAVLHVDDRHAARVRSRAMRCAAIVEMRRGHLRDAAALALRAQREARRFRDAAEYWHARAIEMRIRLLLDRSRYGTFALRQLERAIALAPARDPALLVTLRRLYFEALFIMQDQQIDELGPEWRAMFDDGRVSAADLALAVLRDAAEIGAAREAAVIARHLRKPDASTLCSLLSLVDEPLQVALLTAERDSAAVPGTENAHPGGRPWMRTPVAWEKVRAWQRGQETYGAFDARRARPSARGAGSAETRSASLSGTSTSARSIGSSGS